jgi:hypothetical protein
MGSLRIRSGFFIVLVAWLMSGSGATFAAAPAEGVDQRLDGLFGEHEPYRVFLRDLQRAVAADSRQEVAAMVSFPLRTRIKDQIVQLGDAQQFLAHYDEILTHKTCEAILRQPYESLFANSRGVMIGTGQVWFSGICQDAACRGRTIRIIAFNP